MKVIMKPIELVAKFDLAGNPQPVRFLYDNKVIDVEQVLEVTREKLAGNRMLIFSCQSEIDGELTRYDLKYELQTYKWFLYKM